MAGDFIFDGATMGVTILRVRDLPTSIEWYREQFGVDPLHVGADGPEHPIATYHVGGVIFTLWQLPPGTDRPDVADVATYALFLVDGEVDLEARRQRLANAGVKVDRAVRASANNRFIQFYDPDGNRWELSQAVSAAFREAATDVASS